MSLQRWFGFDALGNSNIIKRVIIAAIGIPMWFRFAWRVKTDISGMENLEGLPDENVLFISNHQTYFAETSLFFILFAHLNIGLLNRVNRLYALFFPRVDLFYVAASETMKSGLLPRIFKRVGAVSVQRTWREKGKEVERKVNPRDTEKIRKALRSGWLITFPQGTTKAYSPVRKGTAHIIKETEPVVVPIQVDGFRRTFDKKGLLLKKSGTIISVSFQEPKRFNLNQSVEEIIEAITKDLNQHAVELNTDKEN